MSGMQEGVLIRIEAVAESGRDCCQYNFPEKLAALYRQLYNPGRLSVNPPDNLVDKCVHLARYGWRLYGCHPNICRGVNYRRLHH